MLTWDYMLTQTRAAILDDVDGYDDDDGGSGNINNNIINNNSSNDNRLPLPLHFHPHMMYIGGGGGGGNRQPTNITTVGDNGDDDTMIPEDPIISEEHRAWVRGWKNKTTLPVVGIPKYANASRQTPQVFHLQPQEQRPGNWLGGFGLGADM